MISVIVPIYNVEEYLPACIESILNQTYKNLEILLIDDGSTDNSGKICDEYAKQDKRCIVVHQQNKGVSETRNTGLNHATGEYISFIDGDDYIHPQMLEILYEALQKGDYDFSMILYKEVYTKEKFSVISDYVYQEINQDQLIYNLYNSSLKNNIYPEINFHVIWNKLYKKNFIGTLSFIKTSSEDTVFNNSLYLKCKKAIIINQKMYYWVQRPTSITHQGIDSTYINRILSYYQCLKATPLNHKYRTIILERLYKSMVTYKFNARKSPLVLEVRKINKFIKKETFTEFLLKSHIPVINKIKIFLPLYFPFIFKVYVGLYILKEKINKSL